MFALNVKAGLGTPDLVVSEFESQSYYFYLELTTSVDNEYQYPMATHFKYLLACTEQHLSSVFFRDTGE